MSPKKHSPRAYVASPSQDSEDSSPLTPIVTPTSHDTMDTDSHQVCVEEQERSCSPCPSPPRFTDELGSFSSEGDQEHVFPFTHPSLRPTRCMFNIYQDKSAVMRIASQPMFSFRAHHFSASHDHDSSMRGGFGSVIFRKLHDRSKHVVAIKFPLRGRGASRCFSNEVYFTGVITPSPNIVNTLGYYYNNVDAQYGFEATAIVMMKYDGSFFDFLQTGGGCLGSIRYVRHLLHLLAGIADGLAHMHAHGIIHNDLSCMNVFVRLSFGVHDWESRLPDAVIGDFGKARYATDFTPIECCANWLAKGSEEEEYLSPASDSYSLGTIVLSALCGVSRNAPSIHEDWNLGDLKLSSHLVESMKNEAPALRHVVDQLVHVVERCTESLPSLRLTASQAASMLWRLFADLN